MPIPTWHDLLVPVLQALAQGQTMRPRDLTDLLADQLGLTDEEKRRRLPSGDNVFRGRVNWAANELYKAGLLERPAWGQYRISKEGKRYLRTGATKELLLRIIYERRNQAFVPSADDGSESSEVDLPPEEAIDRAVGELETAAEEELLDRVHRLSPQAFEQLVLELLKAMGYGARGEGLRVGRSGDQGVDVEIAEDALGLERICVQAKRYGQGSGVGSAEVRDFLGSLDMRGVDKGVFITSGTFAPGAREVAERARRRVVLVDGPRLVRLMRAYGVGVRPHRTIVLHRLDEDFFSQLEEEA